MIFYGISKLESSIQVVALFTNVLEEPWLYSLGESNLIQCAPAENLNHRLCAAVYRGSDYVKLQL